MLHGVDQEVLNGLLDPEDECTVILQNMVQTVYQSTQQPTFPKTFFNMHEGC
jgi:hypothetical protein